jgi:hypothetical protein
MNKNTILLIVVLVVVAGVSFFFINQDTTIPATNEVETVEVSESSDYIGMTVEQAEAKAIAEGTTFHIVEEDGQPTDSATDYQEGRISASVEAGIVTNYYIYVNSDSIVETADVGDEYELIIEMTAAEAAAYLSTINIDSRIVYVDGTSLETTTDYVPGRINLELKDGLVSGYSVE